MPRFILDYEDDLIKVRICNPEMERVYLHGDIVTAICYDVNAKANYYNRYGGFWKAFGEIVVVREYNFYEIKERFKDLKGINLEARLLELERESIHRCPYSY